MKQYCIHFRKLYYRNFFDYYKINLILKYHNLKTITLPKFETVLLDDSNILNDFCCVCYNKFDISNQNIF